MSEVIAQQIRQLRADRGWTQAELAQRVGTYQTVISRMESGSDDGCCIRTLQKIAAAFDVVLIVRFEAMP